MSHNKLPAAARVSGDTTAGRMSCVEACPALQTGQRSCHDADGREIACGGSGQDAEFRRGLAWPNPRFEAQGETIVDRLTDLQWQRAADLAGPVMWEQALAAVATFNRGMLQWRLPNINELELLVDCSAHGPALPAGHPFNNVRDVYWSSTTSLYEPDWAWALYLDIGAVGVGQKRQARFCVWAVSDV